MAQKLRLFLSYVFDEDAENAVDTFKEVAEELDFEVITGKGPDSNPPPHLVRSRIFSSDCFAALMTSSDETGKTSAWISNEIGIAYALDMPLLICKGSQVEELGLVLGGTSYQDFDKKKISSFKLDLYGSLTKLRSDERLGRNESLGRFLNSLVKRAADGLDWTEESETKAFDDFKRILDKMTSTVSADSNLLRIYSSNEIVPSILKRLNSFDDLDRRLSIEKEKKQALGKAFVHLHAREIKSKYKEIFIESGSTLVEIAKCLSKILPKPKDSSPSERTGLHVRTNNAFAYLYFWLCQEVFCEPIPEGPPDPKFGGMFGPLTELERDADYKSPLCDYDSDGLKEVEGMSSILFGKKQNSLILAATSGFQLSDKIDAIYPYSHDSKSGKPYENEVVLNQIKKNCRGFHVGSYKNHLFKRCLFLTGIPIIVFVHDEKIDCPIEVGKCHFLFDSGLSWTHILKNYPLSIWVGCERLSYQDTQRKIEKWMLGGNWESYVYSESTDYPVVIAHNESFRRECKRIGVSPFGTTNIS